MVDTSEVEVITMNGDRVADIHLITLVPFTPSRIRDSFSYRIYSSFLQNGPVVYALVEDIFRF